MSSRSVLIAAAIALFASGVACLFAPRELLSALGDAGSGSAGVLVQLLGAAYLGLGGLDWLSKGAVVGGIYGRPLVVANLAHFGCGTLVLARAAAASHDPKIVGGLAIYCAFALLFALVLFGAPRAAR